MAKRAKSRKKTAQVEAPQESRLREEKRVLTRATRLAADVQRQARKLARAVYASDKALRDLQRFVVDWIGEPVPPGEQQEVTRG